MPKFAPERHGKVSVPSTKSVSFRYVAPKDLTSLLRDFRSMCNEAIKIALQEAPKNRFALIKRAYQRLKKYGLHTHYVLSACEVAYSVYRNKNREGIPHVRRPFLKLDNQSYRLDHLLLRIPTTPRKFIFLRLQGSDYHFSFVDDPNLRRGSVTVTEKSASIAFSKEVEPFEPLGCIGIDVNERNVTVSATGGHNKRFNELAEIAEIKERYREIRAKVSRKTRQDRRISKELLAKYGKRERDRTLQRIHKVTRQIVNHATEHKLGIKVEKLTGIRRLYRNGNGQTKSFRARMNSWVYGETQRQIDYKARWDGVPCWYLNPRGTSSYCLCGSRVVRLAERKLYCPKCDRSWDRDDLASERIMACAVPQARPSRGSDEEERGGDGSNPPSGWREANSPAVLTSWFAEL